ncbi:E3 UFM1-protein ligase 1 [Rhincodon typus]|uniref:E3 UFM1-protein ligase 1 n=1 Tax=Rhincodon typus TaxID=259920 RepID=UPI00202F337B|nr:E3 UFM1-protein ligase 1 [Rhincodon typus]
MAADWDEIRRLAADFQRAQFASTVQRLSERNCVEIVAKLIAEKQLDVVHTLDGKEYITPAQIAREIRDELYINGGRINIVDLQHILNVDLTHIESKASDIAKSDSSIQFVLGQLIDETYLDQMAEEVNDRLQEAGQVTIAELCKLYDLPADFLTEPLLPTSFSEEDASILLQQVMRTMQKHSASRTFGDTIVVSEQFISSCVSLFEQMMQHKAEKEVQNNHAHVLTEEDLKQAAIIAESMICVKKDKREDRKKKALEGAGSIRAGGGGNAREIRTRKTKKKGKRDEDSDEEMSTTSKQKQKEIIFMAQEEIEDILRNRLEDCPEEMICELAEHLMRPLSKSYQEVLHSVFMSTATSAAGANRKKTVKELQEEVSNFHNNIRLFEKGAKLFPDDTHVQLGKHLLKTICTDISNLLFNFLAGDLMMAVETYTTITAELRLKILAKLPEETRGPLSKLHNALSGKNIEEFLTILDGVAEVCGIMLKKGDKKKERQVIFQHRQALLEQVKATEEPALVLHLTSVLLFQLSTHNMLHAPGRCVPQIITFLMTKIPEDQYKLLLKYQGLVVKQLVGQQKKGGQADDDPGECNSIEKESEYDVETVRKELQELTPFVKDLVLKSRKTSLTEE